MQYISRYNSPLGEILLAADEHRLTGLWFEGAKYYAAGLDSEHEEKDTPVIVHTKEWLSVYFSGREPDFMPKLNITGTPFRLAVWSILQKIPYGKTVTYGEIAREIASQKGISQMSAQAVGGAVAHNKISIIIPCHRVISGNKSLTGYAGGIDKKAELLRLENCL